MGAHLKLKTNQAQMKKSLESEQLETKRLQMLVDEESQRRIKAEHERDDLAKKYAKASKELEFERKQVIRVSNTM